MNEKTESLQRAVDFGLANGKKNMIVDLETLFLVFEEVGLLRQALLPFAAAASRPGRLTDCMTDNPLDDRAVVGLGIRVSAWKCAIELTK